MQIMYTLRRGQTDITIGIHLCSLVYLVFLFTLLLLFAVKQLMSLISNYLIDFKMCLALKCTRPRQYRKQYSNLYTLTFTLFCALIQQTRQGPPSTLLRPSTRKRKLSQTKEMQYKNSLPLMKCTKRKTVPQKEETYNKMLKQLVVHSGKRTLNVFSVYICKIAQQSQDIMMALATASLHRYSYGMVVVFT